LRLLDRNIETLLDMNDNVLEQRKRGPKMEILIPMAFLVTWIILQLWVLPRFGVKT
jgi:hypothetical protein